MTLYVSIVLLATLTALPSGEEGAGDHGEGVHGVGGGGNVSEQDVQVGLAQLAGAAFVAVLCTIPVVVVGDADEVQVTTFVPALLVGIAGYVVARVSGRTKTQSLILGGVVVVVGLTVASVKNFLVGH